jgi:hypothetical protein
MDENNRKGKGREEEERSFRLHPHNRRVEDSNCQIAQAGANAKQISRASSRGIDC